MRLIPALVILIALAACLAPATGQAAAPGHADLTFSPASVGPLRCSATTILEFLYTPGESTPDLRGYNVTVHPTGGAIAIGAGDFVNRYPWGPNPPIPQFFEIVDNHDGSFTVSAARLGGTTGLGVADTLFALTLHTVMHGDGAVTLPSAMLRDLDNGTIPIDLLAGASVTVDCWPPEAASGIVALPLHEKVRVSWTDSPTPDVVSYQVWRGLWHDGTNKSIYPEYDDVTNVVPTRPVDFNPPDPSEWSYVGSFPAGGAQPIIDAIAPRGVYYYEVFAVDLAGNRSLPATLNDRSTNYWLGDVEPYVDGFVEVGDISVLGDAFGTLDGEPLYRAVADVGPTDDNSRLGVPSTDSRIDFEDLMVFAMNFGFVYPKSTSPAGTGVVVLSFARLDETTWSLRLEADCPALKGLRLTAVLPPRVVPGVIAGELLDRQGAPSFLRNLDAHGLDVSLALLGQGLGLAGMGELLRVTLPADAAPSDLAIAARGVGNEPLRVALTDGGTPPAATRLESVAPNPFNPSARIGFALSAPGRAQLAIYSLDGRLVASLLDAELSAGRHAVTWNGRDGEGRTVATGSYVCRLEASGRVLSRKLSLLK